MQGIKIGIQKVGAQFDICLLNISGYVDTTTCQELSQIIQELIQEKHFHIIGDLGGVTYISSAGWGVFMGEIKGIREKGGDIKVVHMNPEVFEVFEMLEFNRILNYYDSVEEAINDVVPSVNESIARLIGVDFLRDAVFEILEIDNIGANVYDLCCEGA